MEGLRPTLYVPMRAFALATRDLGSQGGANLVGLIKPQDIGVIGWSAVVRSGSTILGPLRETFRSGTRANSRRRPGCRKLEG
jgi:hypothetical protein